MKITKSVVLAGALCVFALFLSVRSQTAYSQPKAPTQDTQISSVAAELRVNIGKDCSVEISGRPAFEGNLKSVTSSWIIIEDKGAEVVNSKYVQTKVQTYIALKDVKAVEFTQRLSKK